MFISKMITVEEVDNIKTGASFRKERLKAGVSLREVARQMGISAAYLSDLERGNRNWTRALANRYERGIIAIPKKSYVLDNGSL
jgi:predicted transcriptional regulator